MCPVGVGSKVLTMPHLSASVLQGLWVHDIGLAPGASAHAVGLKELRPGMFCDLAVGSIWIP